MKSALMVLLIDNGTRTFKTEKAKNKDWNKWNRISKDCGKPTECVTCAKWEYQKENK